MVDLSMEVSKTFEQNSAAEIAQELGERLKYARLNSDLTQAEVAERAGVARKTVLNAEKGKAQFEVFVGIMIALNLTEHLDRFLPKQTVSPIELAKLQGKQRQRASGQRKSKSSDARGASEW